jgi:hypothetical protein
MLNFDDGVSVDTSGPLRPLRLHDGLYVVGKGMLVPVDDLDEAREFIVAELEGSSVDESN